MGKSYMWIFHHIKKMNELILIDKEFSLKNMENFGTVTIHVQKTAQARAYQSSAIIMNF